MNIHQAVNFYHAAFLPTIVGACGDEVLTADTPASALAKHHGLPQYISDSQNLAHTAKKFKERQDVVKFLREWADALDQTLNQG